MFNFEIQLTSYYFLTTLSVLNVNENVILKQDYDN